MSAVARDADVYRKYDRDSSWLRANQSSGNKNWTARKQLKDCLVYHSN